MGKIEFEQRLMDEYSALFDLLVKQGSSEFEAAQILDTIFDWKLRNLKLNMDQREDEFAASEALRVKAADDGLDFAALWIEAAEKGDGSEKFIEKLMGLSK